MTLKEPTFHVEVLDSEGPGSQRKFTAFDLDNPAGCTPAKPCTKQGDWGPVSIGFVYDRESEPYTLSGVKDLDKTFRALQKDRRPVTVASIPACAPVNPSYPCLKPGNMILGSAGLTGDHEYYLKRYLPNGNPENAVVVLGDPWGFERAVPLPMFLYTFRGIYSNDVVQIPTRGCACTD